MKKKKSQSSGLSREEDARLQEMVDLIWARGPGAGSAEGYVASFREALAQSPRLALALVESLGDVKTRVSGEILMEISGLFSDKKYKRAVKRAAYRLRDAGCLEEDEGEGAPGDARRVLVKSPEPLEPTAWASRVDHTGAQALMMVVPSGGGYRIALFVIDAIKGIRNLESTQAKRAQAEKVLANFRSDKGLESREIPLAHGAYLVGFGLEVAKAMGASPPAGAAEIFDRLKELCGPESFISSIEAGEGAELQGLLDGSADAARWDAFRTFLLPKELILPFAQKLKDLKDSPIVLTGGSQAQMMAGIMEDALAGAFSPEVKRDLGFRLRETAVHLELDGKRDDCLAALAAALDLEDDEGPSSRNLFCKAILERSLKAAGADLEPETKQAGQGLIEIP